jgi:integrase
MSRRSGQNPKVRVGKRADGTKYFFFQYWVDSPGREERQRRTEIVGLVGKITKSEAERKKLEFISNLKLNSNEYKIPSTRTFADAVKFYREVFAPRMLRASTFYIADGHLKQHLEADWNETPIEHIDIDAVNDWIWKKRQKDLSWVAIKNILRTMQRVLSCFSKDKKPPFSQQGLAIPEKDKLRMKIESRETISISWQESCQIAEAVSRLERLDAPRRDQYSVLFLLAAGTGIRCGELFALRIDDLDFEANTIRIDESLDQLSHTIGPCKNAAAYRTLVLGDEAGREAMRELKRFVGSRSANPRELVFHSRNKTALRETNVLHDGLHPVLKAIGLPRAGMHAFRHGCNRRWELSGVNPAVIRQQMGHTSATMTAFCTGEIPIAQVRAAFSNAHSNAFSNTNGTRIVVLENMENEAVA